ncbi:MAG: hypothetical protein FD129_2249, partial [bacterium]
MAEWRLVEREGKLYLMYSDTLSSEPKLYRNFWLMGRRFPTFGENPLPPEGYPVRDCRNGIFEALVNPITRHRLRLTLAGDRRCDMTEEEPVPAPKTRQPTRWRSGFWEKFTKKDGWLAV